MAAPVPENEPQRLEALRRYKILDTTPEAAFDDVVRLAADICETPIALVSLVDEARQWFKARVGIPMAQTPREVSFCAHAVSSPDPMVVQDALADPRFANNPLVTGDPKIRFYAGAPLVTPDGFGLGALCVIDRKPRKLSRDQMTALEVLSRHVMTQLELRRVIAELHRTQEEFRTFSRNVDDLLYSVDSSGQNPLEARLNFVNDRVEAILGYTAEELSGDPRNWGSILHPDDLPNVTETTRMLHAEGREMTRIYRVRHKKTGEYIWLEDRAVPRFDEHGTVIGQFGVARDITERKRAADMLARLQAERVANVSTMAGLTAHEVGNPASVIVGHTYLLKEKVQQLRLQGLLGWEGLRESLEAIEKAAEQIQNVTKSLTAFVRPPEPAQLVEVNRLLDDTARLLSPRFRSGNVTVAKELDPNLPPVPGNAQDLNQTFLNLLLNALQAMPSGGALTLRTRRSAGFLEASVSDTGGGMTEEVQRRIFQPFFTTKPNGSGLGLVMAKSAAEQHGGTLSFESRPGRGTTFILRLPLPQEASGP